MTSAILFTHRFVGPCKARDLQLYTHPDILSISTTAEDGTILSVPHAVLRLGRSGDGQICLHYSSELDADVDGCWLGSKEELTRMLESTGRILRLWHLSIRMSRRMDRILRNACVSDSDSSA